MNESEFENSLRNLSPAPASPSLAGRIAAEMSAPAAIVVAPPPKRAGGILAKPASEGSPWFGWLRGLAWAGAGAAVAVAVFTARIPQPAERPTARAIAAQDATALPVVEDSAESTEELIATDDEGLIYEDGSPQRQLRMTYLEHYTWTNPRTGAVIEMEVPREDIVLMPVAMQ